MNIDDETAGRLAKVLLDALSKGAYVGTHDSDLDDIVVDGPCDLIAAARAVVEALHAPPAPIDSAARTVEDVRRLAPTAGWYWLRPTYGGLGPWNPGHLRCDPERWWDNVKDEYWSPFLWADEQMVTFEIVGPIPEPS